MNTLYIKPKPGIFVYRKKQSFWEKRGKNGLLDSRLTLHSQKCEESKDLRSYLGLT